jgi:hypothetical protein
MKTLLPLPLVLLLPTLASSGDLIVLTDQSEIHGEILSDDGQSIVVTTVGQDGRLTLPYSRISSINRLPAPRILAARRESDRARKACASRGVALPASLHVETRGAVAFAQHLGTTNRAPRESQALFRALAKFRLVPHSWDPDAGIARWRSSRRYAEFDPDDRRLRLLIPDEDDPGRFDRFWSAAGRLPEAFPISRETARAVLDAGFGLGAARTRAGRWEDRALALESAESGLASALALEIALDGADEGDSALALVDLGAADDQTAPPFLRAWRILAEREGARLARAARALGGWRLALRILDDPPASSEQVLHPEKYLARRDAPTLVSLPVPTLPEGAGPWAFVRAGTLGEWLLLQSLLAAGGPDHPTPDESSARKAAEGWDGDAWVVFEAPGREPALLWFTVWDTPEDAAEFGAAAADAAIQRAGRGRKSGEGSRLALDTDAGHGVVEWRGRECVVVEAFGSADAAAALAELLWRDATRREEAAAQLVTADEKDVRAALAGADPLAGTWTSDPPKAEPMSGGFDSDPRTGARRWGAAGAFALSIPEGWEARAEPAALVLTPPDVVGLSVRITYHRLATDAHPLRVFARAWALACPRGDGAFLPYRTQTADGHGWLQFVVPNPERRVHQAWAVDGRSLVRVEALAPAAGAPENVKKDLQAALAGLRFDR